MRESYEKWWEHISDGFEDYSRLLIGHPDDNPTLLNCHDWHADEPLQVWDQEVIRERKHKNGFWALEVIRNGEYEFTCRTYPRQQDTWLGAVKLKLQIGNQVIETDCDPMQSEVKLRVSLERGRTELQTWFYGEDGTSYGVPFVYVEKL
jgi:hypothetical protein